MDSCWVCWGHSFTSKELEGERLGVEVHPLLPNKFKVILGYLRPHIKENQNQNKNKLDFEVYSGLRMNEARLMTRKRGLDYQRLQCGVSQMTQQAEVLAAQTDDLGPP